VRCTLQRVCVCVFVVTSFFCREAAKSKVNQKCRSIGNCLLCESGERERARARERECVTILCVLDDACMSETEEMS